MEERSVARGFAVLSVANIFVKILSLLYIPFLLAIIGDEGNGIYAAAYQVYVFIYVLTNSGIPVAISKLVSELIAVKNYKDAVKSFKMARSILIAAGIVMSILMLATAASLSKVLHYNRSYLAILALSPTLLFTSVASAYRGYFQGRGNMKPTAVSQILEQVINTIFTLVFAALLLRFSLEAACAGGTIGTSLGALCSAVYLTWAYRKNRVLMVPKGYKDMPVNRYSTKELFRLILAYSIPITLTIGLQYAGNLIDVGNTKVRLEAAGFTEALATIKYSYLYKYQQLLNAPISIVAALSATILPAVAAAVALKDNKLVQDRVNFAFRLCFMITIPSAIGMSVLSGPIFSLLKYGSGSDLMMYGSSALVLLAIVQIQTSILQGSGKLYAVTFNLIIGIITKILANYFLIANPYINIYGAILGSIAGYCVSIILNMLTIKKHIKISQNIFKLAFKPLISAIGMGIVVYFTYYSANHVLDIINKGYLNNMLSSIISIIIGTVTYFGLMLLFRGITEHDLEIIPTSLRRIIPGFAARFILRK